MTKATIEKKSRVVIGILALLALGTFLATTFGSSSGVLTLTIATGIMLSALLLIESAIVSYIKKGKYKDFTFGDIAVYLGVITGVAVLVFSISLIPTIGEVIPAAITSFTTTFARIIASIAVVVTAIFIFTPRFD